MQGSGFDDIGLGYINYSQSPVALNENVVKQEQASTFHASRQQKLQKNKISAQNSRIKKKKQIQQLQNSEKLLLQQISECQHELSETHLRINELLTKSKQNDSFNHDQKPTYQRLKHLIRSQPLYDQDQAHMLIQLLINRVGVTGKQRERMVSYYTKRLINFSIPAIYRYVLVTAAGESGLFGGQEGDWDWQLKGVLDVTEEQVHRLNRYKGRIQKEERIWTGFFTEFNQVRTEIYNQSRLVEQSLLQLKQILSIKQIGQTIISIQNRKYNKQISFDSEQFMQKPLKKVKQQ